MTLNSFQSHSGAAIPQTPMQESTVAQITLSCPALTFPIMIPSEF